MQHLTHEYSKGKRQRKHKQERQKERGTDTPDEEITKGKDSLRDVRKDSQTVYLTTVKI